MIAKNCTKKLLDKMVKVNKNKFIRYYKLVESGEKRGSAVDIAKKARLTKGVVDEIQKNYGWYKSQYLAGNHIVTKED